MSCEMILESLELAEFFCKAKDTTGFSLWCFNFNLLTEAPPSSEIPQVDLS